MLLKQNEKADQTQQLASPRRRHLLAGSAVAMTAAGLAAFTRSAMAQAVASTVPAAKPLPAYVTWKDANAMIVHTSSTLETKRSAFGTSIITPTDQLYIRNNLPAPDASIIADRDGWAVSVEGVKNPRTLTVKDLKSMGLETMAMVLQCSGNGRGLFPTKPSGTPWQVGAAGCVVWSGVPVRAVVEALGGINERMPYMTGTGGEKLPEGIDPKSVMVERSVPVKAMADALLAWEMNGEPIPLAHGGPLRLIVPGYTGVNNVKYIKRLAFTAEQTDAAIQKTGYRISPPGQKGDPSHPSVWEMGPKSWINSPAPESGPLVAGPVQIKGVAFGGINAVKSVEVSVDGGKTWKQARLVGPDMGRYAWRQFVLPATLEPGSHTIACMVVDAEGNRQPEGRVENAGGYNNNSWRDHALTLSVV
ncbi:sulfite oxidase [Noviherbaspirillum suwonense]|uniref:Sulfite dehydrogenase (Cytochrome) subunit SorA apoprotein n=1 Tax=Noviherbaspirillum suwonense TaxID=1224511 RepID=A0ABY1Q1U4_9BURK|nr:sulfite oxidase [Noviherbaspirillum suwonense]SMP51959.1 sulfite dehydrogenase (cytochrome) subunit SorA apoprotein [Noviherbaspirillum suwonense]